MSPTSISHLDITHHGHILHAPTRQPQHTTHSVAYHVGRCFQLDQRNCLLVVSMDEQGGHDLCVGNDAFIFQKLSDIKPENAIPLNSPDPDYSLKHSAGTAYLAKYTITGGFVPLGAKLPNGNPHPAAGTGLLISEAVTFDLERSQADQNSEATIECLQVSWDGANLRVNQRTCLDSFLGHTIVGLPLSHFLLDGDHFLAPFTTEQGIVVIRFDYDSAQWQPTQAGQPFRTYQCPPLLPNLNGEFEPCIQKLNNQYLVHTRGCDPNGRLYTSSDGLNYQLAITHWNNMIPQVLNAGLDGSLYLATNPNKDLLRNPLVALPFTGDTFGDPIILHDEDGIRDDKQDKIPFVDLALGVNVFLENRWRHLLWYRICDLKERSVHGFMEEVADDIYDNGKPRARSQTDGLYLLEINYDDLDPAVLPFQW